MEAGTAGVAVLEAGERLAVVGIGLGESMRVAVSVDSGGQVLALIGSGVASRVSRPEVVLEDAQVPGPRRAAYGPSLTTLPHSLWRFFMAGTLSRGTWDGR